MNTKALISLYAIALCVIPGFCIYPNLAMGYSWPVKPFYSQHYVKSTLNECRSEGGIDRHHFHDGIDIGGKSTDVQADTAVFSVTSGIATVYSSYVYVGAYGYFHIDPTVNTNDFVKVRYDTIGTVNYWNHLHFCDGYDKSEINPLRPTYGILPFSDSTDPTVHAVNFYVDSTGGAISSSELKGKVDIVAKVSDAIDSGGTNAGIYKVGYEILDGDSTVYGPIYNLIFDTWLDSLYIETVYALGSNTTNFFYIVTNNETSNNYWDVEATTDAGEDYICRIHAFDRRQGYDSLDVSVSTAGTGVEDEVSVTVTSPNGGEQWEVGSEQSITWSASAYILGMYLPVEYVVMDYSIDAGWEYPYAINDTIFNTEEDVPWYGSYSWTVPYPPAEYCKVRIATAWGTLGDVDVSDLYFTIYDSTAPAAITDLTANLLKVPSSSGLVLDWSAVTIDVEGYPEQVDHYTIYRDTIPYFEAGSTESLAVVTDTTLGYFDSGVVGDVSTNYFYLVSAVDHGQNKSGRSNEVGEFDRQLTDVKKSKSPDGFNLVSWPLLVHDTDIQKVFADSLGTGCQLTGGYPSANSDEVMYFDASTGTWSSAWYKVGGPGQSYVWQGTLTTIDPDKSYWVVIRHAAVCLTMTGGVCDTNRLVPIQPGDDSTSAHNFVGTCYPVTRQLSGASGDDCGLLASGFTGGYPSGNSDELLYFDGITWYNAWYKIGGPGASNVWRGKLSSKQASEDPALEPGCGYILEVKATHSFTNDEWVYPPPPAKGAKSTCIGKASRTSRGVDVKRYPKALRPSTNRSLDANKRVDARKIK